jgi:hypothetical protein
VYLDVAVRQQAADVVAVCGPNPERVFVPSRLDQVVDVDPVGGRGVARDVGRDAYERLA